MDFNPAKILPDYHNGEGGLRDPPWLVPGLAHGSSKSYWSPQLDPFSLGPLQIAAHVKWRQGCESVFLQEFWEWSFLTCLGEYPENNSEFCSLMRGIDDM